MIKKVSLKLFSYALIFLLLIGILPGNSLSAQAKLEDGLKITPLRSYPVQQPGETKSSAITLSNLSDKPLVVNLTAESFNVTNENYDYDFAEADYTKWIRFVDTTVTLQAKQSQAIAYTIEVPTGASAGGYYLALIAAATVEQASSDIIEVRRVASLIYLEIGGDITKETKLLSSNIPWLLTKSSLPVNVRIANTGTSHNRSRVLVSVSRWPYYGHNVSKQLEGLILPNTIRSLDENIDFGNIPGVYTATIEYAPPQGGVVKVKKYFVYIPIWFSASIFILIIGLIVILRKRKKIRRASVKLP